MAATSGSVDEKAAAGRVLSVLGRNGISLWKLMHNSADLHDSSSGGSDQSDADIDRDVWGVVSTDFRRKSDTVADYTALRDVVHAASAERQRKMQQQLGISGGVAHKVMKWVDLGKDSVVKKNAYVDMRGQFLQALASQQVVMELSESMQDRGETVAIQQQADASFYTTENLERRADLKAHKKFKQAVNLLWKKTAINDRCSKTRYFVMYVAAYHKLVPEGSIVEAMKILEGDWSSDLGPGGDTHVGIDYDSFFASVFNLVDVWSTSLLLKDYVAFVRKMLLPGTKFYPPPGTAFEDFNFYEFFKVLQSGKEFTAGMLKKLVGTTGATRLVPRDDDEILSKSKLILSDDGTSLGKEATGSGAAVGEEEQGRNTSQVSEGTTSKEGSPEQEAKQEGADEGTNEEATVSEGEPASKEQPNEETDPGNKDTAGTDDGGHAAAKMEPHDDEASEEGKGRVSPSVSVDSGLKSWADSGKEHDSKQEAAARALFTEGKQGGGTHDGGARHRKHGEHRRVTRRASHDDVVRRLPRRVETEPQEQRVQFGEKQLNRDNRTLLVRQRRTSVDTAMQDAQQRSAAQGGSSVDNQVGLDGNQLMVVGTGDGQRRLREDGSARRASDVAESMARAIQGSSTAVDADQQKLFAVEGFGMFRPGRRLSVNADERAHQLHREGKRAYDQLIGGGNGGPESEQESTSPTADEVWRHNKQQVDDVQNKFGGPTKIVYTQRQTAIRPASPRGRGKAAGSQSPARSPRDGDKPDFAEKDHRHKHHHGTGEDDMAGSVRGLAMMGFGVARVVPAKPGGPIDGSGNHGNGSAAEKPDNPVSLNGGVTNEAKEVIQHDRNDAGRAPSAAKSGVIGAGPKVAAGGRSAGGKTAGNASIAVPQLDLESSAKPPATTSRNVVERLLEKSPSSARHPLKKGGPAGATDGTAENSEQAVHTGAATARLPTTTLHYVDQSTSVALPERPVLGRADTAVMGPLKGKKLTMKAQQPPPTSSPVGSNYYSESDAAPTRAPTSRAVSSVAVESVVAGMPPSALGNVQYGSRRLKPQRSGPPSLNPVVVMADIVEQQERLYRQPGPMNLHKKGATWLYGHHHTMHKAMCDTTGQHVGKGLMFQPSPPPQHGAVSSSRAHGAQPYSRNVVDALHQRKTSGAPKRVKGGKAGKAAIAQEDHLYQAELDRHAAALLAVSDADNDAHHDAIGGQQQPPVAGHGGAAYGGFGPLEAAICAHPTGLGQQASLESLVEGTVSGLIDHHGDPKKKALSQWTTSMLPAYGSTSPAVSSARGQSGRDDAASQSQRPKAAKDHSPARDVSKRSQPENNGCVASVVCASLADPHAEIEEVTQLADDCTAAVTDPRAKTLVHELDDYRRKAAQQRGRLVDDKVEALSSQVVAARLRRMVTPKEPRPPKPVHHFRDDDYNPPFRQSYDTGIGVVTSPLNAMFSTPLPLIDGAAPAPRHNQYNVLQAAREKDGGGYGKENQSDLRVPLASHVSVATSLPFLKKKPVVSQADGDADQQQGAPSRVSIRACATERHQRKRDYGDVFYEPPRQEDPASARNGRMKRVPSPRSLTIERPPEPPRILRLAFSRCPA